MRRTSRSRKRGKGADAAVGGSLGTAPVLRVFPESHGYLSVSWRASQSIPGVRYAIRRMSLRLRQELVRHVQELTAEHGFLRICEGLDPLDAARADLFAAQFYLQWGLAQIEGLSIDGQEANAADLIEKGPECLSDEIVRAIQIEAALLER